MEEKYIRTCKPADREEGKPYCVYNEDDDSLMGRFESAEDAEEFLDNAERYSEDEEKENEEEKARPNKFLTKSFQFKQVESSDSFGKFEAYASVFNNIDRVGDVVLPGAFAKTIQKNNGLMKLQYNHKETIGMAKIWEDDKGLKVSADVNLEVQTGREVMSLIKQGAIDKMSFAYEIKDDEKETVNGKTVYKLKELDVFEVSAVDFPANPETEITSVKEDRQRRSRVEVADSFLKGINPLSGLQKYVNNLKGEK
tara:strand:+ start:1390 stop:2151 length:762 start_codon:yes stop_codon:yes gene_type:complete